MSCEHGCNGCDECTDYEDRSTVTKRQAYLAIEVALLRIAAYPRTRAEELSIEGAREIARATLAYCKSANV